MKKMSTLDFSRYSLFWLCLKLCRLGRYVGQVGIVGKYDYYIKMFKCK